MTWWTVTEYLCQRRNQVCSVCRNLIPVFLSPFMTYHRICDRNTTTVALALLTTQKRRSWLPSRIPSEYANNYTSIASAITMTTRRRVHLSLHFWGELCNHILCTDERDEHLNITLHKNLTFQFFFYKYRIFHFSFHSDLHLI